MCVSLAMLESASSHGKDGSMRNILTLTVTSPPLWLTPDPASRVVSHFLPAFTVPLSVFSLGPSFQRPPVTQPLSPAGTTIEDNTGFQ